MVEVLSAETKQWEGKAVDGFGGGGTAQNLQKMEKVD